jgi:hypothetical protein
VLKRFEGMGTGLFVGVGAAVAATWKTEQEEG